MAKQKIEKGALDILQPDIFWVGGITECVKICPTDAIAFVDAGSTGFDKMRAWAAKTDAGAQAEA